MVSLGTLFRLQWFSSPSNSTRMSLGSNRSSTAFLGPNERVSSTYFGGDLSKSLTTTVFLTLNRGTFLLLRQVSQFPCVCLQLFPPDRYPHIASMYDNRWYTLIWYLIFFSSEITARVVVVVIFTISSHREYSSDTAMYT